MHFVDGYVGWIHTEGHGGYLTDLILRDVAISREDLANALHRCRRAGVTLGAELVDGGLLGAAQFDALLLEHTRGQLLTILEHPRIGTMMYLPAWREQLIQRVFSVNEIAGADFSRADGEVEGDEALAAAADHLASALRDVDGVIGCGVMSTASLDPRCQLRPLGEPNAEELHVVEHWAGRLAIYTAAAVDNTTFVVGESVHLAGAHQIYERRGHTETVFVIARAATQLGAFLARVRIALGASSILAIPG